eukprot:TRINITY_DN74422_c0_g1_i1.p1 TRINITY_DN74422_c0_g1~~TRINITY_DN74422_c0_g1_i1.p1  ORF type:complete len:914 (+),score=95.76 TRINITY_DN74422_c0_g1_i1:74-2815(+)
MWSASLRRPLMDVAIPFLFFARVVAYNMWHTIDPMMVVCPPLPRPTDLPAGAFWPTKQEFVVPITFEFNMDESRPHVVTFMKRPGNASSITFDIVDADDKQVLPTQTVELQSSSASSDVVAGCACTGSNTGVDTTKFPVDYGKSCKAWDAENCDTWFPNLEHGPWCCQKWCYVSSTCETAFVSELTSNLYFAFSSACGSSLAPQCKWADKIPNPCECINIDRVKSYRDGGGVERFGAGYGASCGAWDMELCPAGKFDDLKPTLGSWTLGSWCCSSWCYVDQTCPSAIDSMFWAGLFWSQQNCPDNPELVSTCPYKEEKKGGLNETEQAACACTGTNPSDLNYKRDGAATLPNDYGTKCKAWDKDNWNVYWPKDTAGIFACQSWCYVSKDCVVASQSVISSSFYYSYEACDDDGPTLASCKFSDECKPLGSNTPLTNEQKTKYGDDYGSACGAWDKDQCSSWWNETSKCCESWAYVNKSCPFAEISTIGVDAKYSYDICENAAESKYISDGTCTASRRLATRRRAASTSLRRRASPSRPSAPAPRRRAASYSDVRRRAPPPRRRSPPPPPPDLRRRAPPAKPPASPPATSPRRRNPRRRSKPAGSPTPAAPNVNPSLRRRTTGVSGTAHSLDSSPRRRASATSTRRRASTYGYSNTGALTNNYGGTMPSQTPYGFSGTGPKKNSKIPIMMGAAAGVAGGAVLGAGAYYMYSRYDSDKPLWNSVNQNANQNTNQNANQNANQNVNQNANQNLQNADYCRTSSAVVLPCIECVHQNGQAACTKINDCFSSSQGCSYQLNDDMERHDVMGSGFVPMEYSPPLKIRITKLTGSDFAASSICPSTETSQFRQANAIQVDLFMTLTELTTIGNGETVAVPPSADASFASAAVDRRILLVCLAVLFGRYFRARGDGHRLLG